MLAVLFCIYSYRSNNSQAMHLESGSVKNLSHIWYPPGIRKSVQLHETINTSIGRKRQIAQEGIFNTHEKVLDEGPISTAL